MVLVLRPERGLFSIETIKRWAADTLFFEEGKVVEGTTLTTEQAVAILHRYDLVRVKQ